MGRCPPRASLAIRVVGVGWGRDVVYWAPVPALALHAGLKEPFLLRIETEFHNAEL